MEKKKKTKEIQMLWAEPTCRGCKAPSAKAYQSTFSNSMYLVICFVKFYECLNNVCKKMDAYMFDEVYKKYRACDNEQNTTVIA